MKPLTLIVAALGLLLNAAIFGFFYAWVCSTMWGLDATEPSVAIAAMQAMNASVRNPVFAPAFFGTPIVLLIAAALAGLREFRPAALAFAGAAVVYGLGGLVPTVLVNVPMNQALAAIRLPLDAETADAVWSAYSEPWQRWNVLRTIASGLALLLTGYGILRLGQGEERHAADGNRGTRDASMAAR